MTIAKVRSSSNPDKVYEIVQSDKDGTVYCTCPAWKFSKSSPKMCKHMKSLGIDKDIYGIDS